MPDKNYLIQLDFEIVKEVNHVIGSFYKNQLCTMHDLLSDEFLFIIDESNLLLGKRLSYLVSRGYFPLTPHGLTSCRHNQYQVGHQ